MTMLFLVFGTILCTLMKNSDALCFNMTTPYAFTFPYDFGPHYNFSYEFWLAEGLVDARSVHTGETLTFGFLFGTSRYAPPTCDKRKNLMQLTSGFNVKETQTKQHGYFDPLYFGLDPLRITLSPRGYQVRPWGEVIANPEWTVMDWNAKILNVSLGDHYSVFITSENNNPVFAVNNHTQLYTVTPNADISGRFRYKNQEYVGSGKGFVIHSFSDISESSLHKDKWAWFVISLNNSDTLIVSQFFNGSQVVYHHLIVIASNSSTIETNDFNMTTVRSWTSSRTRVTYPIEHLLSCLVPEMNLLIEPNVDDNEFFFVDELIGYEAVSKVSGTFQGQPIRGVATTELKGF